VHALARPAYYLGRMTSWLGACGNAGLIVGSLVGAVVAFASWAEPEDLSPNVWELVALFGLLSAFAWFALLVILVGLLRMSLRSVALPTLVNTLLVVGLTLIVAWAFEAYDYAWAFGPVIGALIGLALCYLARLLGDTRQARDDLH
jgi:MFS family permease